jgi:hypothetical protein
MPMQSSDQHRTAKPGANPGRNLIGQWHGWTANGSGHFGCFYRVNKFKLMEPAMVR